MVRILAGTSGWSYPAWKGRFYPPELASAGFLAHYASRLPAVEVNNTFYRMPRPATLAAWRSQVQPGFSLALKAPQRITHLLRLAGVDEAVGTFYRAAAELGPALGPILFQLPPTLGKDLGRLRALLALLPAGGRAALEFRHPSWRDEETYRVLAEAGAALCLADDEEGETPLVPTARFGYLRLRRPGYDDAALAAWARRIAAQPWADAFVFFKHEDEAIGPALALRMQELTGSAEAAAPGP
ncbi:MAG TPA: DUF72 domain-containing protein [Anaeromyxobacter sp.]|nr:DUF72 domain-containing protein [Anaeromyxobacter sp.]